MKNLIPLIALSLLMGACGPSSSVTTPDNFVALLDYQVEWKPYHYKSVSPDGAVIVVREHDNEELKGSLAYWTEALTREIKAEKGYTLLASKEVKAGGLTGNHLQWEALYGGENYRYDIALFVTDDLVVTVETAGSAEQYERYGDEFDSAVKSLRLD
jgi:hypothetical protein